MIYLQFMAVPIGAVILFGLGYMILGLWNECGAAWKAVSERDEKLTEAKQRICDLLKENELANKECEQHRIVIEAAKEERLKLLKQQGEDANALMELREARMSSARVIASMDQKIDGLLKDVDARSEVMRKQAEIIVDYRTNGTPARGENGRFARRQVAG